MVSVMKFQVNYIESGVWQIKFASSDVPMNSVLFNGLADLGTLCGVIENPITQEDFDYWEFSQENINQALTLLTSPEKETLVEMPVSMYDLHHLYHRDGGLITTEEAEMRIGWNCVVPFHLAGGGIAVPTPGKNFFYKLVGTTQQVEILRRKLNGFFPYKDYYCEYSIVSSEEK